MTRTRDEAFRKLVESPEEDGGLFLVVVVLLLLFVLIRVMWKQ